MFSATFHDDGTPAMAAETRHMSTARRVARAVAADTGREVVIAAGGTARTVILPDGSSRAPGEERPGCTRDEGACFCIPCRDERRAARRRA